MCTFTRNETTIVPLLPWLVVQTIWGQHIRRSCVRCETLIDEALSVSCASCEEGATHQNSSLIMRWPFSLFNLFENVCFSIHFNVVIKVSASELETPVIVHCTLYISSSRDCQIINISTFGSSLFRQSCAGCTWGYSQMSVPWGCTLQWLGCTSWRVATCWNGCSVSVCCAKLLHVSGSVCYVWLPEKTHNVL
jgi:hypothetical protein